MEFEPLIHISEIQAITNAALWSGLAAAVIGGLTYLGLRIAKNPDALAGLYTTVATTFFFSMVLVGFGFQGNQIEKNEDIVFHNLSQKYQVEEIKFPPPVNAKYREHFPEQSEPQPLTIKVDGETRNAILIQNRDTSEPVLLDVDSGDPMEDILK